MLILKYLRVQLRAAAQYRASFILLTLGQVLTSLASFAAIALLFYRFGSFAGYSIWDVSLCYGLSLTSFSFAEFFARGFDTFSRTVISGDFDRILLRPRHTGLQVLGSRFEFTRCGRFVQAGAILIWAAGHYSWTVWRTVTLLLMIAGGAAIFVSLFMIYAAFCFFTLKGLEFMNIFTDGGREVMSYPLAAFGRGALKFFTYVIPFACVQYYPFLYITGISDDVWLSLMPICGFLFLIPGYLFWQFGVRRYQSTGS